MKRPENPFVGPRSFQANETLYGRDKEVADLVDLIVSERIVLLFSPSGAGKSSLIQAALLPALIADDFACLGTGRFGSAGDALPAHCNPYGFSLCLSLEQSLPREAQLGLEALIGMDLTTYLGQRLERLEPQTSPLIVLDQFEEILTLNPTDSEHKFQFFQQLGKALHQHELWCLFAMREDFLAGLDPYRELLPNRLDITYRLNLLERGAALAAIRKPAARAGVAFAESAATALVDNLSEIGVQQPDGSTQVQTGIYVEPVQLQVVCRRLWEQLPEGSTAISSEDVARVGNVDQALQSYYACCVAEVAHKTGVSERILRAWCGSALIIGNSLRGQVVRGQSGQPESAAVDALIDTHLLRIERRRGTAWLELAHDRLVRPILADNQQWFAEHLTYLQRQVPVWEQQGRPAELLLKGKHLLRAERELSQAKEALTPVEAEFLRRSRRLRNGQRLRVAGFALLVALMLTAAILYHKNQQQALKYTADIEALKDNIASKKAQIQEIEANLELRRKELQEREAHLDDLHAGLEQSKRQLETSDQARAQLDVEVKQLKDFEVRTKDTLAQARAEEARSKQAQQKAEAALLVEKQELSNLNQKTRDQRLLFRALDLAARVPGLAENDKYLAGFVALEAYAIQKDLGAGTGADVDRALRTALAALGESTNPVIAHEQDVIYDLELHPTKQLLCWGTSLGDLVLMDLRTGSQTRERLEAPIRAMVWSPDGQLLAVGFRDAPLKLFRYQTHLIPLPSPAAAQVTYALCFSSDSKTLYCGHKDGSLSAWRLGELPPVSARKGWQVEGAVLSMAQNANTGMLAIAADRLWLWSPKADAAPAPYGELGQCYSLAWSKDNRLAVGTRHQGIAILNPLRQEAVVQLFAAHAIVTGIAFDGASLVSSWSDGVLRIWDEPREDRSPREIKGHNRNIIRMVAGEAPATFYTCSADQTLRRWSVDTQALVDPLCTLLKDAKPTAKWRQMFPDLGGYRGLCPNLPSLGETP